MTCVPALDEDPGAVHRRRRDEQRTSAARLETWDRRISDARLVVFVVMSVLIGLAFGIDQVSWVWIAPAAFLFVALVVAHDVVARRWRRARRAAAFHERGLARVEGRWPGTGEPGTRFLDESHPYAADLDLFGPGSLFERLNTARTRVGEETLAAWLKQPAGPETVRERQAAVAELRPRLDLREELALLGEEARAGIDVGSLLAWAGVAPRLSSRAVEVLAHVLGTTALALLVGWLAGYNTPTPFLMVVSCDVVLVLVVGRRVRQVVGRVDRAGHDLAVLGQVLQRIERESFGSPMLIALRARLDDGPRPASRRIERLGWYFSLLEYRKNAFFAPLAAVMLWTTRLAFAVERWRARNGPEIARWLAVVGEFEAIGSLAAFAFEEPDSRFPELGPGPLAEFEGEGLGHPLLPHDRCVVNDVALGGEAPRLLIVSGSNMSGKSTLLRTMGTNAVLAQAGSTVRAARLRMTPLMPGATLRVQDSLQAGKSRFFAEISRLRQVLELAEGAPPVLFLLDEVLHGTNSHDRRVGAEAVVLKLLDLGAIGLVTTHDLALTTIGEDREPRVANVHFQDGFADGQMTFDYRMWPGVVGHSNALELMRTMGIQI